VPGWRNGIRGGLKIPCPSGRAGSTPAPGTRSSEVFTHGDAGESGADQKENAKFHLGRFTVKMIFLTFCSAAFIALTHCPSTFAQQAALQKVRVLCLNRPLPVIAAQSQGVFAKYGIEVELMVDPGSERLRNDLAAGKGEVAFLALDNAVAMVDSAAADAVILMGGESSLNELIVQPEIKSVTDLRGRKVLVDAPNTAYALQLKKILLMNGLRPGTDFDMKPVGSTQFRLKAMNENKENAASILNPPFSILARHDGLVSLGSMQKLLGADLDRGTFALRSWAREHADLLERYLAGYVQGQRWVLAPSSKQQVVTLVMKESNLTEQLAGEWYANVVQAEGYPKDARFDLENFKKTLQLRAEVEAGGKGKPTAAEKYFDVSYYKRALSKIK
jgi:ABC-type nitrate/sulfonate/bicarbonate transport system substrate-binding protein